MDVQPVKTTSVMRNSLLGNTGGTRRSQTAMMVAEGSKRRQGSCGGESRSFGETQSHQIRMIIKCIDIANNNYYYLRCSQFEGNF